MSFRLFLTFLHHGIEKVVGYLVWKLRNKKFKGRVGQMCHRCCSLAQGFYTKLYTKSAVSKSSIALARLSLTFNQLDYLAKLGDRPTILDSHSDKVLKDFIDQKRDENIYKISLIRYSGVQQSQQGRDSEKSSSGLSSWNLAHLFSMLLATKNCLRFLIFAQGLH